MSRLLGSVESLKPLLTFHAFLEVGPTVPQFAELLVYTDHGTGTRVTFRITERARPTGARDRWQTYGVTPWAHRYVPLISERCHPHLDLVLGRHAELEITATTRDGREIWFPPRAHHELAAFSDYIVSRESEYTFRTRAVYPLLTVRRPQLASCRPPSAPTGTSR